jgi:hypothetical protein
MVPRLSNVNIGHTLFSFTLYAKIHKKYTESACYYVNMLYVLGNFATIAISKSPSVHYRS